MVERIGDYLLKQSISRGRCEVFAAEDERSQRRVAVKLLPVWFVPPELRDRLETDMALAMQLPEEHIAPIEAWGQIDGRFYIQMPLLEGTNLQKLLDDFGALSPEVAISIVEQIANALDAAHAVGLVHSYLAPENILLTSTGEARLLGFGYQAFLDGCEHWDDVVLGDSRLAKRSIGWCPEGVRGMEWTARADTFALACVLRACLTGGGGDAVGVVIGRQTDTVPLRTTSQPILPEVLERVTARGMAKNPQSRYACPGDLARAARTALGRAKDGGPVGRIGRYRLGRMLGDGRSRVYEAEDTETRARVAIKLLAKLDLDTRGDQFRRFRQEADAAARRMKSADEPHAVLFHEIHQEDGQPYAVLPLIKGVNLSTVLRDAPLPAERAVAIISQVAAVLDAAHGQDLMHCCVEPDHILVGDDGDTWLTGFQARGLHWEPWAGQMLNPTLHYIAPEWLRDGKPTFSVDVYALACVLYECLTGALPFPGDTTAQLTGHLAHDPPKPTAANSDVPAAFDAVVARGMAKQPEDRYPSAGALAEAARAALIKPVPGSHAAPTVALPLETWAPAATHRFQLDCEACGRRVVRNSDTWTAAPLICPTCSDDELPQQLVERFRRAPGAIVTIAGHTLLEELDPGGLGPLFRALSVRTGRLRRLRVAPQTAVTQTERTTPPLAHVGMLDHPGIAELVHVIPIGRFLLVVSEDCPGDSAEGLVRRIGPLTVRQAVPIALQCLDALVVPHGLNRTDGHVGITHGHITPRNILLTWSEGKPHTKIADFGLAPPAADLYFTPRPQLLDPARARRPDVDAWRVAACLYFLLTGSAPRQPHSGLTADMVARTTATPIRRLNPDIAPQMAAVIDDALVDTPEFHVANTVDLGARLRQAMSALLP